METANDVCLEKKDNSPNNEDPVAGAKNGVLGQ